MKRPKNRKGNALRLFFELTAGEIPQISLGIPNLKSIN
jgi:hypothetical protein